MKKMKKTKKTSPPPLQDGRRRSLKRLKCTNVENRISSLPDEIILSIVSMLPIKEWFAAVTTIAGSKDWRRLTSLLPRCEHFSLEFSASNLTFLPPFPRALVRRLDLIIYRYLPTGAIWRVIEYAKDASVEELNIYNKIYRDAAFIPYPVLDINSLRALSLDRCTFFNFRGQPTPRISCSFLQTLMLEGCYIHQNILNLIILNCPLLETVYLSGCKGFDARIYSRSLKNLYILDPLKSFRSIDINAPNLEIMQIRISQIKLQELQIQAPKVQEVQLDFSHPLRIAKDGGLRRFLQAAEDLKVFELNAAATKVVPTRANKRVATFSLQNERLKNLYCLSHHLEKVNMDVLMKAPYEDFLRLIMSEAKAMKKMRLAVPNCCIKKATEDVLSLRTGHSVETLVSQDDVVHIKMRF
ncbi:F-box/LRR-repeat protein [Canna indica]|uniref:F-box/LRR-repeat protein n=1 Tax=Canna indica TaxID=4628 RepID=A0AAQ3PWT5_9LILI|nr:F-box/LRR-repeat protein [Canna indica]